MCELSTSQSVEDIMTELARLGSIQPIQSLNDEFSNVIKLKDVINNAEKILQAHIPDQKSKLGTLSTFIHKSSENALFNIINAGKWERNDIYPAIKRIQAKLARINMDFENGLQDSTKPIEDPENWPYVGRSLIKPQFSKKHNEDKMENEFNETETFDPVMFANFKSTVAATEQLVQQLYIKNNTPVFPTSPSLDFLNIINQ